MSRRKPDARARLTANILGSLDLIAEHNGGNGIDSDTVMQHMRIIAGSVDWHNVPAYVVREMFAALCAGVPMEALEAMSANADEDRHTYQTSATMHAMRRMLAEIGVSELDADAIVDDVFDRVLATRDQRKAAAAAEVH